MSENALAFCHDLAAYLGRVLIASVHVAHDAHWQDAELRLYRGQAHLGIVCGLQYVLSADRGDMPGVDVIAAPVMHAARYENRPIYFSDVIVRRDNPARSLADLRGCHWAVNEQTSHSGYALPRFALASRGFTNGFFGKVTQSGAHLRSLELLLAGSVDATAIDSTVLEQELRSRALLASELRVADTLGPSPIPPLVISRSVSPSIRSALTRAVLEMHLDAAGAQILASAAIKGFVPATNADYEAIRAMHRLASSVEPWPTPEPVIGGTASAAKLRR